MLKHFVGAACAAALTLAAGAAGANGIVPGTSTLVTGVTIDGVSGSPFEGTDCAGLLGRPPNCSYAGSPLILKINFNSDGSFGELVFGNFASIDGSEFRFDFGTDGNTGTGTWIYTPGPDDPAITAFVAKGGPNFNLFTYVVDWTVGSAFSGDYFTPTNPQNDKPFGLSHVSFYDTGRDEGGRIPEPGSMALLLLAGAGLVAASRRGRHRA